MINIAHVIISLDVGGAEGMLERLAKESAKNPSIKQSIITLKKSGVIGKRLTNIRNIDVISLDMSSIFVAPVTIFKLRKIFKIKNPDIVYTWMYHSDLIGGLAAYFSGIKNIVWGIRGTKIPQRSFSTTSALIKICSLLSFYIPKSIVCCAEAARLAHIDIGYCPKKMIVIPNGYDLSLYNDDPNLKEKVRNDLNISEETLLVGVVGRFDPLKDFDNFVQAASLVCKTHHNVKFIMVGRGLDKNNAQLNNWIQNTSFKDRFILIGEANPYNFYAAMDIFCLSSKAEGFPNVVAESMAMGVPCVVTNVGDAAKIVRNSGKVVEPMNANALYKGLISMLDMDYSHRKSLGDNAKAIIKKEYDIKIVMEKFLKLVKT